MYSRKFHLVCTHLCGPTGLTLVSLACWGNFGNCFGSFDFHDILELTSASYFNFFFSKALIAGPFFLQFPLPAASKHLSILQPQSALTFRRKRFGQPQMLRLDVVRSRWLFLLRIWSPLFPSWGLLGGNSVHKDNNGVPFNQQLVKHLVSHSTGLTRPHLYCTVTLVLEKHGSQNISSSD